MLLDEIKGKTTRNNVDLVLPLIQWNITKIDLIISGEVKKQAAREAKQQRVPVPLPLLVSRGEIWEANLGYNIGSEQNECRPVLIVQNDANNKKSTNTIVVPLSDLANRLKNKGDRTEEEIIEETRSKLRPTEVLLPRECVQDGQEKLLYPSVLLCQNIREISKERLRFKVTIVDDSFRKDINAAICNSLGLA